MHPTIYFYLIMTFSPSCKQTCSFFIIVIYIPCILDACTMHPFSSTKSFLPIKFNYFNKNALIFPRQSHCIRISHLTFVVYIRVNTNRTKHSFHELSWSHYTLNIFDFGKNIQETVSSQTSKFLIFFQKRKNDLKSKDKKGTKDQYQNHYKNQCSYHNFKVHTNF